jgi:N-acetyl-anhydromuramyl-L-alanine amidase AmpD
MREIKRLVIHVTDSDDSLDIGFQEINEWHRQNGWLSPSGISCGYHYIIRRGGMIELGRPVEEKGAHVKYHNHDTIGIVWVGRKQMAAKQLKSLKKLVTELRTEYNIDIDNVLGHYELDSGKTCPNIDMIKLRAELVFSGRDL